MDKTPHLALPYIFAAQAQKHITHNEAISALDDLVHLSVLNRNLSVAPTASSNGERYLVANNTIIDDPWSGKEGQIAVSDLAGWQFYQPSKGWRAWIESEQILTVFDGQAWNPISGTATPLPDTLPLLAVNATADTTNRLSVKSDAILLSHDDVTPGSGDIQVKVNKAANIQTASHLFQTNWSGRAEIGLTGDDDFHFKVSPDGTNWSEAIIIDRQTGTIRLPNNPVDNNLVINGDFAINQRGFVGGALAAGIYGYDRWKADVGGANLAVSGNLVTLVSGKIVQHIEAAQWGYDNFSGQTVTISVENPSANLTVSFGAQTGTINAGSGRQSVTFTVGVAETATDLVLGLVAALAGSVSFSLVKLEIGAGMSGWKSRNMVREKQLCQRYYYRRSGSTAYDVIALMSAWTTTKCWGKLFEFPVELRTTPTMNLSNINDIKAYVQASKTLTSVSGLQGNTQSCWVSNSFVTSSSFVIGDCVMLYFTSNAGYIEADAEY